jgi:hypothetical protein
MLAIETYISLHFAHNRRAILVNNGINFLDAIEVSFVVRVFDALFTPWYV